MLRTAVKGSDVTGMREGSGDKSFEAVDDVKVGELLQSPQDKGSWGRQQGTREWLENHPILRCLQIGTYLLPLPAS